MKRLPVTFLTGFLGSGKTTLLERVLSYPAFSDTAVIINEFGEIGIDHLIVAEIAEHIVELRGGCLCCTIRGDLALTLRDLHRRRHLEEIPRFARVIVETSGLADPVPLLHTLMANPPLARAFGVDGVITVVDAEHGMDTLARHPAAATQAALADILVLSKIDCVADAAVDAIVSALAALNAGAEVIRSARAAIDPARLLDRRLFEPERSGAAVERWLAAAHTHADHGSAYAAHVIRHTQPLSLAGTSVFLNRLVNEYAGPILRIKGLAAFRERGGQPAILHAVQNKFYPVAWLTQWPDDDHTCRLVIIGHELDTARIDELFNALCV